jgi:hypothetical protein
MHHWSSVTDALALYPAYSVQRSHEVMIKGGEAFGWVQNTGYRFVLKHIAHLSKPALQLNRLAWPSRMKHVLLDT